jgi:hypothetical protein
VLMTNARIACFSVYDPGPHGERGNVRSIINRVLVGTVMLTNSE